MQLPTPATAQASENLIPRGEYLTIAQKALKTAIERGMTLFANGYTIEAYSDRPGIYSVARPENDTRPLQAGETLWNDVDVCNQDCTCECFRWRGGCKHLIAVNKAVANAARLMAPMLPNELLAIHSTVAERSNYGTADWKKRVAADFS